MTVWLSPAGETCPSKMSYWAGKKEGQGLPEVEEERGEFSEGAALTG